MTRPIPDPTELIATVRTLQDAVEVFRIMKERLGLTNDFMDEVGGLTRGHTDKILGRSEQKRVGYDTFALYTLLTAVEFRVYVDMAAVKRMEAVWEKRERPLFHHAKVGRISKKVLKASKPIVMREMGSLGGMVTAHMRSAAHRSESARKAAKSRWNKFRKIRKIRVRCSTPAL